MILMERGCLSELVEIKAINVRIERLASRRSTTPGASHRGGALAIKSYQKIQTYAKNLHSALEEKFTSSPCQCDAPHTVSLQVLKIAQSTVNDGNDQLKFTLLFSYDMVPPIKPGQGIDPAWPNLSVNSIQGHLEAMELEVGSVYTKAVEICLISFTLFKRDPGNDNYWQTEIEARVVSKLRRQLSALGFELHE